MTITLLGSTAPLDRQSGKRSDPAYIHEQSRNPASRWLLMAAHGPVVHRANVMVQSTLWFSRPDLTASSIDLTPTLFLGLDPSSSAPCFAHTVTAQQVENLARSHALEPHSDVRTLASTGALPASEIGAASIARSVLTWHESAAHCGWCGTKSKPVDAGWKRHCPACERSAFPRVDPVVIMLVTDGERALLAHEPRYPPNMYSTLAGYIEPGETIEQAVIRETYEEVGLIVTQVDYALSQPWPFPHSLMIGCIAQVEMGPLTLDSTEIDEAIWVTQNRAQTMLNRTDSAQKWVPGPQAIAHHLIQAYVNGTMGVRTKG
jgi:NAD+ diphosphatase